MSKHTPASLLLKDASPYLDDLDPKSFVRELPDLIENLAIEFPAVNLKINHKNIEMISKAMRRGMQIRGYEFLAGAVSFPDKLKTLAIAGHEAVSLTVPRDLAFCLADDLRRGMASLNAEESQN